MKTKNIFLLVFLLAVISSIFVFFGGNQQASLQSIVSETHKGLNKLKLLKENLNHLEEKKLQPNENQLVQLGFVQQPHLFPHPLWTNTSVPAIVTYVRRSGHEKQAIGLLRNMQQYLPNTTILIYNLGLDEDAVQIIHNYCDSIRCIIMPFDLRSFPSHVAEDVSHAFRPLIIQDALTKVGGVLFLECNLRLTKSIDSLLKSAIGTSNQKGNGFVAWATRQATSSLTHPNMFGYFETTSENFLFLPMVEATKLIIYNTAEIHNNIMLPWVQCALTEDCISPIGAQSSGCHFNKKPQYRYSGCHGYDTSALNIVLGLQFDFNAALYTYPVVQSAIKESFFKLVSDSDAIFEYNALEDNITTLPSFRRDVIY